MADAEQLARHLVEARAQGKVVPPVGHVDDVGAVHTRRDHDRADRVRMPLRRPGAQGEAPRRHRAPAAFGQAEVAREDVVEPLLEQHGQGLAQPVQHRNRRRVGEVSGRVGLHHVLEAPVTARQLGRLPEFQCPRADAHDAQTSRQHEPLLRTGDGDVHLPLVHAEVDTRQSRDAVHEQQRGVLGGIHGLAHRGDIAGDSSRGLVVDHAQRLVLVAHVLAQQVLDLVGWRAFPPLDIDHGDIEPQPLHHVDPEVAELAVAEGQDLVSRRERVHQGRFPAAGPGARKQERGSGLGLEDLPDIAKHRQREPGERGGAMILHRHVHRPQDPVGDVGGTGDEQEVATWHDTLCAEDKEPGAGRPRANQSRPAVCSCDRTVFTTPRDRMTADPRALLSELYRAAISAAAPGPALRVALERNTSLDGPAVHLLALGKAALPMADAAVRYLADRGRQPAGGLIVVPEPAQSPHPALPVVVGDHPEPGPGSLAAAAALDGAVQAVGPDAEVWVLLSGGATSLLGAPIPGLPPDDLTALYRVMLGSGLDIAAMNRIRKRFSRWAGGRLATALRASQVKNFTISDVIGDDLASIGSGPCVPDPSTASDVIQALGSAGLWENVPARLRDHLEAVVRGEAPETPKSDHPAFRRTETFLVASNQLALEAAAARARALGLEARLLDTALAGEAAEVGRRLASTLLAYDDTRMAGAQAGGLNKDAVLIWGGETTVTLTPDAGRGGRSQELALAAAEGLGREGPRGADGRSVVLLAAGTDGRDGPTDAAGGFADHDTWARIRGAGRDPAADLRSHRAYDALEAAGALFKTGMTGTNVMDVVFGLIRRG